MDGDRENSPTEKQTQNGTESTEEADVRTCFGQ